MSHFEEKITYLPDGINVKIDYRRERDGTVLQDSYTIKKELYETMTHEELDAILDAKFDVFFEEVNNPTGVEFIDGVAHVFIPEEDKDLHENVVEIDGAFYIKLD